MFFINSINELIFVSETQFSVSMSLTFKGFDDLFALNR
jgi:hypothetical protein